MKNIFRLYGRDIKSIVTNIMSIVLIGGLIFLPSLYAWLNIKASWDPYGQTDQIPIGFVNEDEGATIRGEDIDIGKELVDKLEEDNNFDWHFVDRDKAMEEIELGNYYAVIVVPEDFSETLGSVMDEEPEKAEMEYYVNEKINAIAPKITDKGASVIVEEISSEFISTVNGIIFEMFNDLGLELEDSMPDIELFEEYVFTLEEELPTIHEKLVEMDEELTNANDLVGDAKDKIPTSKKLVKDGLDAIDTAQTYLNKIEEKINKVTPKLREEAEDVENKFSEIQSTKENIKQEINEEIDKIEIDKLTDEIPEVVKELDEVIDALNDVQDELDEENESIQSLITELEEVRDEISSLENKTEDVKSMLDETEDFYHDLEDSITKISDVDLEQLVNSLEQEIDENIISEIDSGKSTLQDADEMLSSIEEMIPKVETTLNNTETKITEGQEALDQLFTAYPQVQDKVDTLAETIRGVQDEASLQEIIDLLLNDPDKEKSFFAEPVKLHKNEIFPIPNYGTGMTPFYTVLSLWVGGLLLISLLSPNVPEGDRLNPKVVYSGRMLTFITIGLLQTIIVTLGDIFILNVEMASPFWFVIFGLLISFVFMSIVYTAIAILGDVGKAVAIILLVLQIASSGGTYPVVLLPEFFQAVHPFLPFTYGVDLMREAVGGIIWQRALKDIGFLIGFAVISITAGIFLKGPVQKKMKKIVESKGGRLFH